ncbi:MAG: phage scaffolding protein [Clostridia bacterium]|nr:phage scaffolding protein [Clostridia bacterium]
MKKRLMEMGISAEIAGEAVNLFNRETTKLKDSHKNEIYNIKLENAIERAISKSGAKTNKAVKAMLNMEEISLNDKGELSGAEEQLKNLAENEDTKYLFNTGEEISFKGVRIGNSEDREINPKDMNYDELCAYLENKE